MPPRRALPAVSRAGGSAHERLTGAGEHSAPECLQPFSPVHVATVTAAALVPIRGGSADVHGALAARAAVKCCPPDIDLPVDITSSSGMVHGLSLAVLALRPSRRGRLASAATRALLRPVLAAAFLVVEVALALVASVLGALG